MLLAFLVLISAFLAGYSISRKFFKAELFAPSFLFGIVAFSYFLFALSSLLGYSTISISGAILISLLIFAFILKDEKIRFKSITTSLFSPDSFAIFLLAFLLMGYVASHALGYSDGFAVISQDWAVHLGITNSLAEGNFPPQYPYLSQAPLSYYYFSHLFISSLVKGGLDSLTAYPLVIVLLISSIITSIYSTSRNLLKSKLGGVLAIFLAFFSSACAACLINDAAWFSPFFSFSANSGFPLRPIVLSFAFNQLPMALSFLFFAVFLKAFLELEGEKKFLILGTLIALLPMFGPFFYALMFIFITYGILFERNRRFYVGGAIAIFAGALQYLFFFSEKATPSILRFIHFELYAHLESIPDLLLFWLQNAGGHIAFALLALYFVKIRADLKNLLLTSGLLYALSSFIIVFPDMWANEKFFMPFFILLGVFAAAFVLHIISLKPIIRYAGFAILLIALLSTAHQFKFFLPPSPTIAQQSLGDAQTFEACKWIKENTPQNSVFLTPESLEESGCIYAYAGRLAAYSNPYWIWSQGFDKDQLESEQKQMLAGDTSLLAKYRINYVFANRELEGKIGESLRKLLTLVYSNEGVTVYQLDVR
ncbi:MAG: DUF2298 domain-containing protein [Candidatus Micrarchaeota archaeon]